MLKIVLILIVISIIFLMPQIYAQISIGAPAKQKSVDVTISLNGGIHVVHEVQHSSTIRQMDMISGTIQDLKVKDVNGDTKKYGVIGDNLGVTIFPSQENIIVEYDLEDVLFLNDGVWAWDFFYPESVSFYFPDEIDLVFVNKRPVHIKDTGIACHGCQMPLEYIIKEPIFLTEIEWGEKKFPVYIRTLDQINLLQFDQHIKRLSFETNKGNKFITLIIPLELLWNPYEVYFDNEIILQNEFSQNDTHIWLSFIPESAGVVEIIGTSVVPEFSMMIPLVLGIGIVLGFQLKNKINLR